MFYWDPNPEFFSIPYLNLPILWYGVLFTIGFALGFPVFVSILRRYFFNYPEYIESDILIPHKLTLYGKSPRAILARLNDLIFQGHYSDILHKIKSYVMKSKCLHMERALTRLKLDIDLGGAVLGLYHKAVQITDRFIAYMLIATIVGARIGHVLFYENPMDYLSDPLQILRIREGGLASHGAAIGIIIAVSLFARRIRNKAHQLTWVRLLDFVCVPTALCGCFIRLGNFVNQEIFGRETAVPWAVIFGHPIDGSPVVPRHPTQIYEALFYFLVFCFLWRMTYRPRIMLAQGKLIGLFLMSVFIFRFFIEFLKVEQSHFLSASILNMGQVLSLPMVCLGIFLYFRRTAN